MYHERIIIGDKFLFGCGKTNCDFAARIIIERKPNNKPLIECAGMFLSLCINGILNPLLGLLRT